jgi:autotransporter-associated beta strand protein
MSKDTRFNSHHSFATASVLIAIAFITSVSSAAVTNSWQTSTGGSWNTAANWAAHLPTSTEDATIATAAAASSPATVTLDANQTAYGLTLDPGGGKAIHVDPGAVSTNTLSLLSNDSSVDGIAKFFTINIISGTGNQINAPIQLGPAPTNSFPARINSLDPQFSIAGISEASGQVSGVRISGNSQGVVTLGPSTYSGDTTVATDGILRFGSNAGSVPTGVGKGNLVIEGSGQAQFLNATSGTINALVSTSSTSVVTNVPANNGVTFTVGNGNASGTFAGGIQNPTGTGLFNLIKTGTGMQKLTGTNSYRGTTTVSQGTLIVNGTHNSAGSYSLSVSAATLGGTGTINLAPNSSVTLTAGKLAPGDGGPGVLKINGLLNMSSVGTLAIELGGNTPGNSANSYDQVNTSMAINAMFAHISVGLVNGFVPQPSDVFYILTRADLFAFDSPQPFDAFPEGHTIGLGGGYTGTITYRANWTGNQATSTPTGGNDVAIINVVPEPLSAALFGIGGIALFGFARSGSKRHLLSSLS